MVSEKPNKNWFFRATPNFAARRQCLFHISHLCSFTVSLHLVPSSSHFAFLTIILYLFLSFSQFLKKMY